MLIILPKLLLLIAALGLELHNIWIMIAKDHLQESNFLVALFSHLSASSMIAIAVSNLLKASHQNSKPVNILFFFMIAFYMPIVGMLGLILAIIPGMLFNKKTDRKRPIHFNPIRAFSDIPVSHSLYFEDGVASLDGLLRSQNPNKRLRAVYSTLKLDDKDAIPLLRMALRDPIDDIRLLAYALLDRKEQRISERIEGARQSLEINESHNTRHLYKSIVNDYWELAHLGLVEGETLDYVLNKSREYLENGLQRYPMDRGLHFQYGKLLLRLKKPSLAYAEFKMAESLGFERKRLLLYYAEIDFLHRRYSDVKQHMRSIDLLTARPNIHAATCFWQEKASVHG